MPVESFHYEKLGYGNAFPLFRDIVLDLTGEEVDAGGFYIPTTKPAAAKKFDFVNTTASDFVTNVNSQSITAILLIATDQVDPRWASYQLGGSEAADDLVWGLSLWIEGGGADQYIKMSWGRMRRDGLNPGGGTDPQEIYGEMYDTGVDTALTVQVTGNIAYLTAPNNPDVGEDGKGGSQAISTSALHGYDMVTTPRGFALVLFHQTKVKNWTQCGIVELQRPVDNNGDTLTKTLVTDKAPIFVVWNNLDFGATSLGGNDPRWYKGVILEDDVSQSVGSMTYSQIGDFPASGPQGDPLMPDKFPELYKQIHFENQHTLYRYPVEWTMPITQDNNEVPLVFAFGLTTDRFSYLENMDLLCVGPACVFTFGQDITIDVFTENREYRILSSSEPCSGVVVAILKSSDGAEWTA